MNDDSTRGGEINAGAKERALIWAKVATAVAGFAGVALGAYSTIHVEKLKKELDVKATSLKLFHDTLVKINAADTAMVERYTTIASTFCQRSSDPESRSALIGAALSLTATQCELRCDAPNGGGQECKDACTHLRTWAKDPERACSPRIAR